MLRGPRPPRTRRTRGPGAGEYLALKRGRPPNPFFRARPRLLYLTRNAEEQLCVACGWYFSSPWSCLR